MQRAWNKHGETSFSFEPLLLCAKKDLVFFEQRALDALKPAYNMCPSAGSMLRFKMSEEVRAKLSQSHKGQIPWMKGRKHSEESKRKNSLSKTGQKIGKRSPEMIRKVVLSKRLKYGEDVIRTIRVKVSEGKKYAQIARELSLPYHVVTDVAYGRRGGWVSV
jgi:group I intron endonuclease